MQATDPLPEPYLSLVSTITANSPNAGGEHRRAVAELQVRLALAQERLTKSLTRATWALVLATVMLAIVTVVLALT